jgi:glycosyltransferase involved in cell wall biosynthesis
MNILFILYGDFTTNTAGPISLFASELKSLGHQCVIAVPSGIETVNTHAIPAFRPMLYEQVIDLEGKIFENGACADVIHTCTLRIGVINFLKNFLSRWPTPLVVYLEDNETWIAQHYLGLDDQDFKKLSEAEMSTLLPDALSNPYEYPYALALADLVILIQEKLSSEVPLFVPKKVIPWGVDQNFFQPEVAPSVKWKQQLLLDGKEKIIVYHGGLNGFTRQSMFDLCQAVEIINASGVDCKLIRTGVNPINFWDELSLNARQYILEIGVVDRNELPSLLALADLYVQPGRINPFEDLRLPSKVPEFLAMGRPVILPNVNIANLFDHGKNAILLSTGEPKEIANACLAILGDEELFTLLSKGAREFAQNNFEITAQTKKLEIAYQEAIGMFHENETACSWEIYNSRGVISAALSRANFRLASFDRSSLEVARQLLKWCEKLNERMQYDYLRVDMPKESNIPQNTEVIKSFFKRLCTQLSNLVTKNQ